MTLVEGIIVLLATPLVGVPIMGAVGDLAERRFGIPAPAGDACVAVILLGLVFIAASGDRP